MAAIIDREVIKKILDHLHVRSSPLPRDLRDVLRTSDGRSAAPSVGRGTLAIVTAVPELPRVRSSSSLTTPPGR